MRHEPRAQNLCPVTTAFVSVWESELGDSERRRLVEPLRARLSGSPTGTEAVQEKASFACDWLVRICLPAWMELATPDEDALAVLRSSPPMLPNSDTRSA